MKKKQIQLPVDVMYSIFEKENVTNQDRELLRNNYKTLMDIISKGFRSKEYKVNKERNDEILSSKDLSQKGMPYLNNTTFHFSRVGYTKACDIQYYLDTYMIETDKTKFLPFRRATKTFPHDRHIWVDSKSYKRLLRKSRKLDIKYKLKSIYKEEESV